MAGPSTPPLVTALRGADLLNNPRLNKGTAFSRSERRELELEGLLPWQMETIEQQVERCWRAFGELERDLDRYAYLQILRERNLTLFHRVLADHIEAVMPIVYTPTVGSAIQHFSQTYRSPSQGLFLAQVSAAATIVSLPVLIAGFAAQDKLVQGLSLGAVK